MELVEITPTLRIPSVRPGTKVTHHPLGKAKKADTATTPPVAVEFPKEKGGKIKVTEVDPKPQQIGETKLIDPKKKGKNSSQVIVDLIGSKP